MASWCAQEVGVDVEETKKKLADGEDAETAQAQQETGSFKASGIQSQGPFLWIHSVSFRG